MKKILVWLSWWVDSAVSAYLLKKAWYDVTAWFMINYISNDGNCPTKVDLDVAKEVANFLWIKFFSFDYQKEYNEKIVEYIYEWYKSWFTPNPDILCNTEIKFKLFLEEAINLWFDSVATWHYVRSKYEDWYYKLLKWIDEKKDQSYFLSWLNQTQLSKSMFPIWGLVKNDVRKIANEIWLPNANRKDSQWLCFIWKINMKDFLKKKLPSLEWNILNINWDIIWKHEWAWFHTIWQRRWIWVSWPNPLYIIDKNIENNTITVWEEKDLKLYSKILETINWHWVWKSLDLPIKWYWKIRYQQVDQECEIINNWKWVKVVFNNEQRAIARWQSFVFYNNDELLWSWIIK